QCHDLVESQRGVGPVGQFHIFDMTGYAQNHFHALGFRFQADIENGLDVEWIVKRDRAPVDRVLIAEKYEFSLSDDDAAGHSGAGRSSTQPQIRRSLQALCQRRLKLNVRRRPYTQIEPHARQCSGWGGGSLRRCAGFREQRTEIALRVKRNLFHRHISAEKAVLAIAAQRNGGAVYQARATVARAHALGFCAYAVLNRLAGESRESIGRDFSATGLSGEVLNDSAGSM